LESVVEAWLGKYPTLPPALRVLALNELPTRPEFEPMAFMDALFFQDPDPLVQRWNLFARVARADDPTLAKLLESADPLVKQVAAAQKERIDLGLRTYSSGGMIGMKAGEPAPGDPPAGGR
jgi:hypothetical protein